eukprot:gene11267-12566_t
MRILTYTNLRSLVKGVEKGYPLQLEIGDFEIAESDFRPEFLQSILPTIDWQAVRLAADAIGLEGIPDSFNEELLGDEDFLQAMHRLLLDINVLQGTLICPESGRKFPIEGGIANLLLEESEL